MQYVPRSPDTSVNVGEEHPLVEAGTLVAGLAILFAVVAVALVVMIEVVLYFVPAEKEAAMFEAWTPADLVSVTPDDERLTKTGQLLQRLSRHHPDSAYDFRVAITQADEMNAMAFPGGLIVVTTGLLDRVQTENELAFILAHEMGHFRNRDHIRALGRGLTLGMLLMAIGDRNVGDFGASIAGLTLNGFSRSQEVAADSYGLILVQSEFGHVADSWRFFERIDESGLGVSALASYTSTHPAPDDRIEALAETAAARGYSVSGEVTPIDWDSTPPHGLDEF